VEADLIDPSGGRLPANPEERSHLESILREIRHRVDDHLPAIPVCTGDAADEQTIGVRILIPHP
jgi:hypothetical protein